MFQGVRGNIVPYFIENTGCPCQFFCQLCNAWLPTQCSINKNTKVFYIINPCDRLIFTNSSIFLSGE